MRTKRMAEKTTAFRAPSKSGDVIFSALVKIAALITLLMLGGIIISLFLHLGQVCKSLGFRFCGPKNGMHRLKNSVLLCLFTALSLHR